EGSGNVTDPGDGKSDVDGVKRFGLGVSTSKLDTENIFGNSSCPQPPSFTIRGTTINGADFPYFCQAAAILRALILMYGAYLAIRILMGWGF
ncbi:virulence factor TspB C-terminal domain-related protein, partial [Xanthomonas citri]